MEKHKGFAPTNGVHIRCYILPNGDRISSHSTGACFIDWGMELHELPRHKAADQLRELRNKEKPECLNKATG